MGHIHTMEYYSAIKKNRMALSEATRMDLEIVISNEARQTEKDKYHVTSLICGIRKKIVQMNLFINEIESQM